MKLHMALDHFEDLHQAKSLLQQVVDLVDIVDVGTPMIMQEGETWAHPIHSTCFRRENNAKNDIL